MNFPILTPDMTDAEWRGLLAKARARPEDRGDRIFLYRELALANEVLASGSESVFCLVGVEGAQGACLRDRGVETACAPVDSDWAVQGPQEAVAAPHVLQLVRDPAALVRRLHAITQRVCVVTVPCGGVPGRPENLWAWPSQEIFARECSLGLFSDVSLGLVEEPAGPSFIARLTP